MYFIWGLFIENMIAYKHNLKKKRKKCYFLTNNIQTIDYKDVELLKKFLSDNGKILPRRLTGTSCKYQRKLTSAIKKARQAGILPYTGDIYMVEN